MVVQLSWLRTFVTVYRLGSLTKAAQRLELSQPTVTHQIRNLERTFGKELFERVPQGVVPTCAADSLIRDVQGPVDALGIVVERHFGTGPGGRPLCVGGPVELISSRVVPAVSDLVADGLRINFSFGLADDLLERLASGHYDLVLSTVRPRLRGISAVTLVDEEFAILASPELASGIPTGRIMKEGPAAVLDKYPLIAYAESLPIIRRYWLTVFGIRPTSAPSLVIPDLRGVLAAVKSSAGISVLPTYLAADALLRGEAVKLLEPEIPPINTFYLATRDGGMCHPDLTLLHSHLLMKARLWV
ncbi:LysR family transcriptional regulator [Streptomyces chrestomyceticus JCM 4735]|uniref:LysR family transcriptional regulator n=1 Tax=Streptomyces chrestomyceticus JCM 4735 TaxID=1306181 RepID=A0A7U9L1Z1_9ACTN|nr:MULTISPECIES: LysR family transcriptional regulator [Streptomyces]GCD39555.1 LysR family transcriptional regulator [Streptomyces chrestomyceticus JCM 4735]